MLFEVSVWSPFLAPHQRWWPPGTNYSPNGWIGFSWEAVRSLRGRSNLWFVAGTRYLHWRWLFPYPTGGGTEWSLASPLVDGTSDGLPRAQEIRSWGLPAAAANGAGGVEKASGAADTRSNTTSNTGSAYNQGVMERYRQNCSEIHFFQTVGCFIGWLAGWVCCPFMFVDWSSIMGHCGDQQIICHDWSIIINHQNWLKNH